MSGNIRPQSSQLTESLRTDPGIKSGIGVREKEKKEKRRRGMNGRTFTPILTRDSPQSSQGRKETPPPHNSPQCCTAPKFYVGGNVTETVRAFYLASLTCTPFNSILPPPFPSPFFPVSLVVCHYKIVVIKDKNEKRSHELIL